MVSLAEWIRLILKGPCPLRSPPPHALSTLLLDHDFKSFPLPSTLSHLRMFPLSQLYLYHSQVGDSFQYLIAAKLLMFQPQLSLFLLSLFFCHVYMFMQCECMCVCLWTDVLVDAHMPGCTSAWRPVLDIAVFLSQSSHFIYCPWTPACSFSSSI